MLDDAAVRGLAHAFLSQDREHAVVLTDAAGRIVGWLAGAERLFGHRAAEVVGQPIEILFTPHDRSSQQAALELDVAVAAGHSEDDRWHLRRDGAAVWVTGALTALHDPQGTLIGFAKVMRDRTDLRAHTETLENRVEGLQQRHEVNSRFMATLGHELRTPLAAMAMALDVIESQAPSEPLAAPLNVLRRQASALQRLASDLMDLSRLDLGRLELRKTRFDLCDLVRDCAEGFKGRAASTQRELLTLLPDAAIDVTADRERLQQVVQNLLDNALKYTRPGGRITVRAVAEPPDAVVRVEDDGCGIAADLLPKVFDLFTRGAPAPPVDGLGIGLAVAKQVVELHGGNIEARSPGAGKGAEFAVRVPGLAGTADTDRAPATAG